jgi:hypothetical protein
VASALGPRALPVEGRLKLYSASERDAARKRFPFMGPRCCPVIQKNKKAKMQRWPARGSSWEGAVPIRSRFTEAIILPFYGNPRSGYNPL